MPPFPAKQRFAGLFYACAEAAASRARGERSINQVYSPFQPSFTVPSAPPVCVVNPFNPCERATVLLSIDECGNLIVCLKR